MLYFCINHFLCDLSSVYLHEQLRYRRVTILDGIEKGLKKGRAEEQGAAAQLAPLLCVQLGAGEGSEEVCKTLKPILLTVANDKSIPPTARAKVNLRQIDLALFKYLNFSVAPPWQ